MNIVDPYWAIYLTANDGSVEWYEQKQGYGENWSRSWLHRRRFGSRAEAMSVLWDLRNRRGGRMKLVRCVRKIALRIKAARLRYEVKRNA